MIGKTFTFVFAVLIAVALADDQEYWIEQSVENANKDLNQWPEAVNTLVSYNDSNPVEDQVNFFKSQVADSVDNMNTFVPSLVLIVDSINSTAAGDPNIIRRSALQAILWFINGKRDNKSYYLLDGAVNWVSNRISELNSKGDRANNLASNLTNAQQSVATLRDQLDSSAQNYVQVINKIEQLSADISSNIDEIRPLANGLLIALQNSTLLKDAEATNDLVNSITV